MAAITIDFQLFFILILLWLVSRFCLSAFFFFKKPKDIKLPPSPPSLPVIGHLHLFRSALCHKSLKNLSSKYGPLLHLRAFNIPIVVVSSGSMVNEVLRNHGLNFASRQSGSVFEESLFCGVSGFTSAPYGEYWRFMKKLLVTKLLGAHSLDRTRLIREEELKTFRAILFDKAVKKEAVEVEKEMMKLTNNSICMMIMGKRCSGENGEAERIRELVTKTIGLMKKIVIAITVGKLLKKVGISLFEKEFMQVSRSFDEIIEKILVEHEENPKKDEDKDMMDVLLEVCADENAEFKITRNHIKSLLVELFLGGTDTSAQVTQWAMAELINHPEILKKLRQEIDSVVGKTRFIQETDLPNLPYLQAVIKEALRVHTPSPILARNSMEGCNIGGFYIAKNTTVIINTYAVMRDPNSWEEPDKFQPERFMVAPQNGKEEMREQQGFNYIPFGSGRRACPGSNLGYIFTGLAIGTMVQGFNWSVDGGKVNTEETGDTMLRMAHPLMCTPVARIDPSANP